jgi:hypothetical protein
MQTQTAPVTRQAADDHLYEIRRAGQALNALSDLIISLGRPSDLNAVTASDLGSLIDLLGAVVLDNLPTVERAVADNMKMN